MKVRASELNKRIAIIDNGIIVDNEGFEVEREIEVCKTWAKMFNKSGTEIFRAGADYSKVITHFIIKYRRDVNINTDMKIKLFGKTPDQDIYYNITYLNNYNYENKYVEIVGELIE